MKSLFAMCAVACAALITPTKSEAATYHLELEGEINLVTFAFSDTVSVGQMATFSLYFDTDVPDADPNPNIGLFTDAIQGQVVANFGDEMYVTTSSSNFRTRSDTSSNLSYTGFGGSIPDLNGLDRTGVITFDLGSSDFAALSSNMLPTSLDLSDFDLSNGFQFVAPSGAISGTFTGATVTAVPLPASGLLLIAALGFLLIRRRQAV